MDGHNSSFLSGACAPRTLAPVMEEDEMAYGFGEDADVPPTPPAAAATYDETIVVGRRGPERTGGP